MSYMLQAQKEMAQIPRKDLEEWLVDAVISWAIRDGVHPVAVLRHLITIIPWDDTEWVSFRAQVEEELA